MTPEVAAILGLILVGLLIFVIDIRLWLRSRQWWRWLEVPLLKDWAIRLVNLLLMPMVLAGGVIWFVQSGDSIWARLVLALAGSLILKHLLFWESYVRLHAPEVAQVEEGTTIWDIVKVVLVPTVLSLGILWLNIAQAYRQDRMEDDRRIAESTVEAGRAQENALQTYLDRMSDLLLADPGLRSPDPSEEAREVARVRTLTVLRRLDGQRKGMLIGFLSEAELITSDTITGRVDIRLSGADLSEADLSRADLRGADLHGADLRGANLTVADLSRAVLLVADLRGSDLSRADLSRADVRGANLRGADLRGADLSRADLRGALLFEADLRGARYTTEPFKDALGMTHQPTRWPANFDPVATGAVDVDE